jgi:hypothetical protein
LARSNAAGSATACRLMLPRMWPRRVVQHEARVIDAVDEQRRRRAFRFGAGRAEALDVEFPQRAAELRHARAALGLVPRVNVEDAQPIAVEGHRLAVALIPVLAVLLLVVGGTCGLPAGIGFVTAVALGWSTYEHLHQSIHVNGPRSA